MKTATNFFSVHQWLSLAEPDKAKNAVVSVIVISGLIYCLNTFNKQGYLFTGIYNYAADN